MPPKPQTGILGQIGRELDELGKKTVKSTVKEVAGVVSPTNLVENIMHGGPVAPGSLERQANQPNATPLDMAKIEQGHKEKAQMSKDQADIAAIRRQFNFQKQQEQGASSSLRKEEQQRQEAFQAEARKKQQEHQQQMNAQPVEEAQGKKKAKLGQARQKAKLPDRKPGDGKQ
jgi:hypothetical protein